MIFFYKESKSNIKKNFFLGGGIGRETKTLNTEQVFLIKTNLDISEIRHYNASLLRTCF